MMGQASPAFPKAEDYIRQIQLDLSSIGSEPENLRYLERMSIHPEIEVRVAVYRMLIALELSVLGRYEDNPKVAGQMDEWLASLESCTVGHIKKRVEFSDLPGGYINYLKIEGANGLEPSLAEFENQCLQDDLEITERLTARNLYRAQECRFGGLHARLRRALSQVKWLQDDFGRIDPQKRAAADRLGAGR